MGGCTREQGVEKGADAAEEEEGWEGEGEEDLLEEFGGQVEEEGGFGWAG